MYTSGRISDEAWDQKSREWRDRRASIKLSLEQIKQSQAVHISNLDAALTMLTKIGILYTQLNPIQQQQVLKQVIKRVVINTEGMLVRVDLRSPFAYFHHKLSGGGSFSEDQSSGAGNQKTSTSTDTGSFFYALGVPSQVSFETLFSDQFPKILFFSEIVYPQRARIEQLLSANAS